MVAIDDGARLAAGLVAHKDVVLGVAHDNGVGGGYGVDEREFAERLEGEVGDKQLIEQLSLYKQAKGTTYDNDYAAILRWVTKRLHEMEKEEANYKEFKNKSKVNNKTNFDQRDYPPGFFDNLYAN